MKIAVVSEGASLLVESDSDIADGQGVHIAGLSAALTRGGHDVTVYTRRGETGSVERVLASAGYSVVSVAAGPGEFAEYLDAQWAVDRPDVAHAFSWRSGLSTRLAARAHGVPTVQTFRSLAIAEHRHDMRANTFDARSKMERLLARQSDRVVASCADELVDLMRLGRPRGQISTVPSGVDVDAFSTEGPIADRGAGPRIVAVGKLLPHNGFSTVINALPGIPGAEYVVAGSLDGQAGAAEEHRRLRELAADRGVSDRLRFVGPVAHSDMPALLRSADVVTCTPWYDAFGLVSLEAMACGVPVVASAVGGMLDAVVHDVTGRLVTPRRPRECAEAVTAILRDSFLRRSLGLAGRDRARARFTWDRAAADSARVYEPLASAVTGAWQPA
ncbi:glycosyl transferase [Mycolicibacterium aromaticivorans JS19b1 = JCM 16368]|uniref:Glycosyl transferase n=1 Tax=Mycolicibacterium aromaticivorans JS19b1 = JCM 16368 TaxID=1440774 RepID=A0A064CDB8_9MYCO|nr:glycosyltransferase [Mycolicibacterium aromaticivorans]KDE98639.1 glycosyl transferase [Mycolicibacterium aromaticivorans JS19b1 = JCM 16368]